MLLISDTRAVDPGMVATIEQDAKKIGITFTVRPINGAYPTIQTPSKNVPIAERPGWGKDYADALTFFTPLFDGRTIIPTGNTNYSLVGITPAQCKTLKVTRQLHRTCRTSTRSSTSARSLIGRPAHDLLREPRQDLMTKVVPWVPWMWSNVTRITSTNVTKYEFDQFRTTPAYSEISVK